MNKTHHVLSLCFVIFFACSNNNDNVNWKLIAQKEPKEYVENFSSGKVKTSGYLLNDRKEGIWKEYDTAGHLLKAIYFEDGDSVSVIDDSDLILMPVSSTHYKVYIPYMWSVKHGFKGFSLLAFKPMDVIDSLKPPTPPSLVIETPQKLEGRSLTDIVEADIETMNTTFDSFKVTSLEHKVINGRHAIEFTYSFKKNDKKYLAIDVSIEGDSYLHKLMCMSEVSLNQFNAHLGVFRIMIDSYEAEEKA